MTIVIFPLGISLKNKCVKIYKDYYFRKLFRILNIKKLFIAYYLFIIRITLIYRIMCDEKYENY